MDTEKVQGFWFSESDNLPRGDGRLVEVGTTHDVQGEIRICENGLHFSQSILNALKYAPGSVLWGIEAWGDLQLKADKGVGRYRKYLWRLDASEIMGRFARACALDVVHLWNAPDIVLEFLKTGDESLCDAAYYAALSAYYAASSVHSAYSAAFAASSVCSAARYVRSARYAAYYARDAALSALSAASVGSKEDMRNKQEQRLLDMIEEALQTQTH